MKLQNNHGAIFNKARLFRLLTKRDILVSSGFVFYVDTSLGEGAHMAGLRSALELSEGPFGCFHLGGNSLWKYFSHFDRIDKDKHDGNDKSALHLRLKVLKMCSEVFMKN